MSILDGDATLDYDNRAYPYVSELAIDTVADLTAGGLVSDVMLSLVGNGPPPPDEGGVAVDDVNGIYEVTGSGNDVWANSDQFHYVYMNLTGDGEISARVVSNGTGSNNWAKGGVMIRETNDADSKHMIMGLTGSEGGGICFQGRVDTAGGSTSYHGDVTAEPPHWVKLTREGNAITAYHSADGVDWALFEDSSPDGGHSNPIDLVMQDKVLVGLFVTSHASGETRTYTIDNVDIQGDVDMVIVNQDIGIGVGNTPAPIYAALEDSTGAVATVPYPFPDATMIELQRNWTIPLSDFEGVDPTAAAKFIVGVGDGEAGGTGSITVSDIKVSESVTPAGIESWLAAAEAAGAGFLASNVSMGIYDIGANSGDITYEFIVNSNPDEQEGSMALIGRNIGDDTKAAIKYEQWNNTETYGATVFGVADHDYGVAISRGVDTHLAFVSSEDLGTTELYVDGEPMGSVPAAITLAGNVGIGLANRDTTGLDPQDPFDGTIWGAAIYDSALTAEQIAANADAFAGEAAPLLSVVRSGGVDGDRDPIGPYDGSTAPLPTEEGGLMDGAPVFSDRTYPWAGIPAEYVGSEYIRTFNSDKNGGTLDVTYEVTIARDAILWVTIDDRIPAEWDAGGAITSPQDAADYISAASLPAGTLTDTGIDIYVREASDGSNDRPMSVYAAELAAGTYVFTSMDSGKNFYSIGAIE